MDADDNPSPSSEDAQEALATLAPPVSGVSSAGALLKAYREEAGMEQETLAAALKVSPQKLQALESDDYSSLPALYFARGLAANICRHLEKDPAPVLALMPDEKPHIPAAEKTDSATMRSHPISPVSIGERSGSSILKWIMAATVLLALIAGAVWVLPQLRTRLASTSAADAASGVSATEVAELSTTAPQLTGEPASAPVTSVPLTLQPATLQPAAVSANTAPVSAAEGQNTLQIHANGDSWINVTAAKGEKLFERNLKAGDTHTLSVTAYPVRISVGKAENVQLIDRGQPVDLSNVTNRGTARVELKP